MLSFLRITCFRSIFLLSDFLDISLSFFEERDFSTEQRQFYEVIPGVKVVQYGKDFPEISSSLESVMLSYIIGIKLTSTNIIYHVSDMKGQIIVANTQNRILAELHTMKKESNSNSITGLTHTLQALSNEAQTKIRSDKEQIVLHLRDFPEKNVRHIAETLAESLNIRVILLTNSNPHNGCRPSKIKTHIVPDFEPTILPQRSQEELYVWRNG
jgi:hypothetical protein